MPTTIHIPAGRVFFTPKRPRGKPRNDRRNVAAFMAHEWFRYGHEMPEVRAPVRSPITAVMELWNIRGYRGLSDYKEAHRVISNGSQFCARFDTFLPEDGRAHGARSFLVNRGALTVIDGRAVHLRACIGWCWEYGAEYATVGTFRETYLSP